MNTHFFAYLLGLCLLSTACPAIAEEDPAAPQALAEQPLTPPSAQPDALQQVGELWSGSLYTSTYRAGVCIDPAGSVRGVLLLRTMGGKTDTYHFSGTLENGIVRAAHGSGHSFAGTFPSTSEVQGTITLKSGRSISLSGKRERDMPLTESCRPLPQ